MRSDDLPRVVPALLLSRLRDGSGWSVVVAPTRHLTLAEQELREEAAVQGVDVRVVTVEGHVTGMIDALGEGPPILTLLVFPGDLPPDAPTLLDLYRSRLPTDRPILLLMTPEAATRLAADSFHFESLIQQVERLDLDIPVLTDREVAARLDALRRWSGRTDAEVLTLAERGDLPLDPDYAEWVVLLGRGDLLVVR